MRYSKRKKQPVPSHFGTSRDRRLLSLRPGEVHLWITDLSSQIDTRLLNLYLSVLSYEEQRRYGRFRFEEHRRQFLVSHALVRWSLSQYADTPPECWQFTMNKYGRPKLFLHRPVPPLRIRFNLSHTSSTAVVAVTRDQDIGVDIETIAVRNSFLDIARRYFSPKEAEALCSLPRSEQNERFFQYWTLKEAFVKAKGMGLFFPLDRFTILLPSPPEKIRVAFSDGHSESSDDWHFWQIKLASHLLLAVCVNVRDRIVQKRLSMRQVVPFNIDNREDISYIAPFRPEW